jgi:hypothetical protein
VDKIIWGEAKMRFSKFFGKALWRALAEAESISHQLLLRKLQHG